MFVTAFSAELDQVTGVVSFVNAGHCEPIVTGADGGAQLLERTGNLPLGVMPQGTFAEKSFTLAAGEMLLLYTDGVTEAADRSGDMFRVQRLLDIARQSAGRSPDELMLAVIGGLESFCAGTVQADDISAWRSEGRRWFCRMGLQRVYARLRRAMGARFGLSIRYDGTRAFAHA
jgi:sigma-B regulation protein RsbU (phosphoserine phosphatase)